MLLSQVLPEFGTESLVRIGQGVSKLVGESCTIDP